MPIVDYGTAEKGALAEAAGGQPSKPGAKASLKKTPKAQMVKSKQAAVRRVSADAALNQVGFGLLVLCCLSRCSHHK